MEQREQMFVEAKRRYEHEKYIAERGNRNIASFDEWCETTRGEFVEAQNGEIKWYCETNNKIMEL